VSSLAERSCGVIFRDEADKWSTNVSQEADPFYLIEERKKDFIDWKIINSGTPSLTHTSRIEKCIQNSDDRRYWVPCPHCGRYQTFEFEQLVLPHDGMGRLASPEVCAEKVYYPCLHCEKHIEDWYKIGIARRGRWVCAHEKIDEHGMLVPIDPDSPAPPRSTHAGFTLSSLYSLKVTWPEIAREWAKAHADPLRLQNFVNSWLARTFSPKGKQLHESQVLKHRHVGTPHQYPADTCKHEPVACVIVVDVQEASLWYEIFAFCKGNRIYQLRYGQMRGELSNIEMLCNLQFTGPGNQKFGPTHCVIDSGFRTSEVYEFCSVMNDSPTSSFIPFKGTEGQSAKSISWSKIDGEGELELLRIQVDVFKDRLTDIVSNPLTDEPHCWRLHENCEIDFARQLTAERRERKITPLGRYKHVWRRTRADNHYWDINVVALATMQALTWEGWDFSE